jgi:hypothetical protein
MLSLLITKFLSLSFSAFSLNNSDSTSEIIPLFFLILRTSFRWFISFVSFWTRLRSLAMNSFLETLTKTDLAQSANFKVETDSS